MFVLFATTVSSDVHVGPFAKVTAVGRGSANGVYYADSEMIINHSLKSQQTTNGRYKGLLLQAPNHGGRTTVPGLSAYSSTSCNLLPVPRTTTTTTSVGVRRFYVSADVEKLMQ